MAKSDKKPTALQRAIESAMGEGRSVGADDDPAKTKYPELWQWLSNIYVRTDRLRTPATVSVTLGPSGALVTVSDRDLAVSCSAACEHLDDVFAALEKALTSDVQNIRSWGKKEPKLRKRTPQ